MKSEEDHWQVPDRPSLAQIKSSPLNANEDFWSEKALPSWSWWGFEGCLRGDCWRLGASGIYQLDSTELWQRDSITSKSSNPKTEDLHLLWNNEVQRFLWRWSVLFDLGNAKPLARPSEPKKEMRAPLCRFAQRVASPRGQIQLVLHRKDWQKKWRESDSYKGFVLLSCHLLILLPIYNKQ